MVDAMQTEGGSLSFCRTHRFSADAKPHRKPARDSAFTILPLTTAYLAYELHQEARMRI